MSKYAAKGQPWRMPGAVNVEDCVSSREVMEKAHLDFNVEKCQLVAKMPFNIDRQDEILDDINAGNCFAHGADIFRDCPDAYATFRSDVDIPLGIVKSRYEIVQNVDAFNFFDSAIGKNEAKWQTAGYFGNGERIFVSAKLPNNIKVHGDIIENYLVFANSHDGSSGVNILFTPIRVICQNTLNAAIKTSDSFVRFRHTRSVHDNIDRASDLLGIVREQAEDVEAMYNHMADVKITDRQAKEYMITSFFGAEKLIAINEYDPKFGVDKIFRLDNYAMEAVGIKTRGANILHRTFEYYQDGLGQQEIAGTAYGAYNAITGYYSNIDNAVGEDRMKKILYGSAANTMANALSFANALQSA